MPPDEIAPDASNTIKHDGFESTVVEILIFGIPEASSLRGSIRLVKLVSQVLTRAYNLSYGAKIYNKCIFLRFLTPRREPGDTEGLLISLCLSYFGSMLVEMG